MSKLFACLALLSAMPTLFCGRSEAQESYPQYTENNFQPTDHECLTRRIEQLEARQRLSGATCQSHLYASYDSVMVKPVFSHNSAYYGQPDVSNAGDVVAVNVPFDYNLDYSPRIEVGYLAPTNKLGWRARYWHFNSNAQVLGVDPVDDAIAIGVGARVEDIDSFSGAIRHSLNVNVGDLEVTHQFRNTVFGLGMRIGEIRQRYRLEDSDEGPLNASMRNIGLGPTASLQWNHNLFQSNWSLYSDMRLSSLFGRHDISATSEEVLGVFGYSAIKPILGAEIQAGLQYTGNRFFGRVGVEAQHWGNVGNLMNTVSNGEDDGDNGILFDGALGFIGVTVGVGYMF